MPKTLTVAIQIMIVLKELKGQVDLEVYRVMLVQGERKVSVDLKDLMEAYAQTVHQVSRVLRVIMELWDQQDTVEKLVDPEAKGIRELLALLECLDLKEKLARR